MPWQSSVAARRVIAERRSVSESWWEEIPTETVLQPFRLQLKDLRPLMASKFNESTWRLCDDSCHCHVNMFDTGLVGRKGSIAMFSQSVDPSRSFPVPSSFLWAPARWHHWPRCHNQVVQLLVNHVVIHKLSTDWLFADFKTVRVGILSSWLTSFLVLL